MYMMKKGRRGKKKIAELSAVGEATLQKRSDDDRYYHELSTETEPREIMNLKGDRAELSDSWTKPPVELDTHQPSTLGGFIRF